jgi:hypothetical protein
VTEDRKLVLHDHLYDGIDFASTLLEDYIFRQKVGIPVFIQCSLTNDIQITHFDHERVPERGELTATFSFVYTHNTFTPS